MTNHKIHPKLGVELLLFKHFPSHRFFLSFPPLPQTGSSQQIPRDKRSLENFQTQTGNTPNL